MLISWYDCWLIIKQLVFWFDWISNLISWPVISLSSFCSICKQPLSPLKLDVTLELILRESRFRFLGLCGNYMRIENEQRFMKLKNQNFLFSLSVFYPNANWEVVNNPLIQTLESCKLDLSTATKKIGDLSQSSNNPGIWSFILASLIEWTQIQKSPK